MRRHVLIVDDDPHTQDLVKFFLEQAGFITRTCKDGHTALDELQSNLYDLVILDLAMPHLNGMKTLRSIRANPATQEMPVVMLTGSKEKEDIHAAKENRVTDHLIKPPQRELLLKRVETVLGGRPQFEEVKLRQSDTGSLTLPISLKSISNNGFTLVGEIPFKKGARIKVDNINLFKTLEIKRQEFKIADCVPTDGDKFEYFVSFIGMTKADQEKLREWIIKESFDQKNSGTKAA